MRRRPRLRWRANLLPYHGLYALAPWAWLAHGHDHIVHPRRRVLRHGSEVETADGLARRVRLGLPAADGDGLPGAVDNRVARALPLAVLCARRAAVPRDRGGAEAGRRLGRGDARLVRVGLGLGLG